MIWISHSKCTRFEGSNFLLQDLAIASSTTVEIGSVFVTYLKELKMNSINIYRLSKTKKNYRLNARAFASFIMSGKEVHNFNNSKKMSTLWKIQNLVQSERFYGFFPNAISIVLDLSISE